MSSKYSSSSKSVDAPEKVFARKLGENDPFFGFNFVFIHYCTSDWWGGDSAPSVDTANFHFRGKNVILEVIKEIHETNRLPAPAQVVFWGLSAGGVGAMSNADRVGELIKQLYGGAVDFRAMMDGSWFMGGQVFKDWPCTSHAMCAVEHRFSQGFNMWNHQVNEQCAQSYSARDRWRCM